MRGRTAAFLWLVLALVPMAAPAGWGCRAPGPPAAGPAGPGEAPGGGLPLWLRAGLKGWQPQGAPDVGAGLEGLCRLVDGAAEWYWARGVLQASFQEWTSPGDDGGGLEVRHFVFRSTPGAGRYFEDACREEGGEVRGEVAAACCLVPGDAPRRALLRSGVDLVVLQLVGTPASNPIPRLAGAFLDGPGSGGGGP